MATGVGMKADEIGTGISKGTGQGIDFHWGPWGAFLYFVVVALVVFGAAVVVVNRRDA